MELGVDSFTIVVDQLEGVRPVAIHVPVPIRSATVRKQKGKLVCHLRAMREEVPDHVRVLQIGLRVSFLCVNERGEQNGISQEEDGRVVAHQIPVALFGVHFDCEPPWIAGSVRRARLSAHGGETDSNRRLLAHA